MRIGLTGTVSVGKTTLVKALQELPEFENYKFFTERSRYLRDLGIPLNTDSTVKGQLVFAAERSTELMNPDIITDRSIWDVCAFTLSSKTIPFDDRVKLVKSFMLLKDEYDIIFYIDPEGTIIENNGVRETDSEYRDKIDWVIQELLLEYPPKKLVKLKGSTEERIQQIKQTL
jgi:nicotinamide riboside kinase